MDISSLIKSPSVAQVYRAEPGKKLARPLFLSTVQAGFPSPAEDYIEQSLDLNEYLVKNPAATFFVRVAGDSMTGAGIHHDDILVVDRSLTPASGKIVIAIVDGELTVKRFLQYGSRCRLAAENPDYSDIEIENDMNLEIWGVVTTSIHNL
ncbi:MAG: translesion error-prone DNA polymerase V autoproteolytic subunit [Proteobacteria bacterium]|nr:translesion error-prone DNA polymerase V autoproteolytic subunit [Pseudomonadota bacterium]MBU1736996.1 translesion error-prone DNA polymerase V autoproteolytic subunit [Pseudomonadota bacterium]